MSRHRHPLTALLIAALALTGCADAEPTSTATPSVPSAPPVEQVTHRLSVTDVRGTTVTLKATPQRIVCLTGLCDDALVELGLTPAATTTPKLLRHPGYLGAAGASVPALPGMFGNEDVASVAAAKPDLVIGLAGVHDQLRPAIEKFAPLWLVEVKTYEDSVRYLRDIATLTDRGPQQVGAEQRFRDRLAAARATAAEKGLGRTTALAMYGGTSIGVNTADDLLGHLLSQVFDYPWPSKGGGFDTAQAYSVEEILARDPDIVFIQSFTFGPDAKTVTAQYAEHPVWKRIRAVRDGRAHEVPAELWASGRGTRALGLVLDEAVAKATA
ncbi:ABC transporter substrate-binding protein [Micromonospora coxensis]|uniref:Iron complex transport system substrate-binding protein n=1 Tax=Micromonospora coxensis TaxID=356852 RepID=A0A1C5K2L3_9ACTN|nr:ABC transporter substrate-binding protein [Micromonospora coxensis]SCG76516.1 iron complex transport system substrate-binding protein [Micromonospora coxensis]